MDLISITLNSILVDRCRKYSRCFNFWPVIKAKEHILLEATSWDSSISFSWICATFFASSRHGKWCFIFVYYIEGCSFLANVNRWRILQFICISLTSLALINLKLLRFPMEATVSKSHSHRSITTILSLLIRFIFLLFVLVVTFQSGTFLLDIDSIIGQSWTSSKWLKRKRIRWNQYRYLTAAYLCRKSFAVVEWLGLMLQMLVLVNCCWAIIEL